MGFSCRNWRYVAGRLTQDELFRGSHHVKGERDFILIAFALEPAEEGRLVEETWEREEEQEWEDKKEEKKRESVHGGRLVAGSGGVRGIGSGPMVVAILGGNGMRRR